MLTFVQFITESDKKIFGNNASGFIKPDGSYVIGHTEHDKLARKHNFIDGLDAVKVDGFDGDIILLSQMLCQVQ